MLDLTRTVGDSIRIATGVISTLTTQPEKMHAELTPEMLATEIADYLVRRGVPFREGHHVSGQVVVLAEKNGVPMVSVPRRRADSLVDKGRRISSRMSS